MPAVMAHRLSVGTQYTLHPEDQRWASAAGPQRRQANKARGTYQPPIDHPDPEDELRTERDACGAEIAFARMVGVKPVLLRDFWSRVPNGQLPNGRDYNVSSTCHAAGRLLVPRRANPSRFWIYVLLHVDWPVYTFLGWQEGTALIKYEWLVNPLRDGRQWSYGMTQRQLRSVLEYW